MGKIYDLLVEAGQRSPIDGNHDGSFLTMRSNGGLLFGACTIASGFSGVFCDQGYWQRAIASRPQSTTKAYTLGALSWFAMYVDFPFPSVRGRATCDELTYCSPWGELPLSCIARFLFTAMGIVRVLTSQRLARPWALVPPPSS